MFDVAKQLSDAGQRRSRHELSLVSGLRSALPEREQEQLGPAPVVLRARASGRVRALRAKSDAHGEAPLRRRWDQEERKRVQDPPWMPPWSFLILSSASAASSDSVSMTFENHPTARNASRA